MESAQSRPTVEEAKRVLSKYQKLPSAELTESVLQQQGWTLTNDVMIEVIQVLLRHEKAKTGSESREKVEAVEAHKRLPKASEVDKQEFFRLLEANGYDLNNLAHVSPTWRKISGQPTGQTLLSSVASWMTAGM